MRILDLQGYFPHPYMIYKAEWRNVLLLSIQRGNGVLAIAGARMALDRLGGLMGEW